MAQLLTEVATAFDEPEVLSTVDWMQQFFVLPDCNAFYDFYNTPYFLGVALALDDPAVKEIVLMKAAQIGWTYFLLGYLLKRVCEAGVDPASIIMLFAKSGDGKNFNDEKLVPAVNASAEVQKYLDVSTTRQSSNRWDNRSYRGGFMKLVGSNSPGNVKSSSKIAVGVVEEPDDTADNVKDQGDSITLLEERLKRAKNKKLIVGGTPAVKDASKTEGRLKKTDRRELPITCHECGAAHVLDWSNVWCDEDEALDNPVYGKFDLDTVVYRCPHCGNVWSDFQRKENIRNTCFKAYEAFLAGDEASRACGWVPTAEGGGSAVGFQDLSELYACMDGTSLADVYRSFLEAEAEAAKGDESKRRAFMNQKLGKAYEYAGDHASADELRKLCIDYQEGVVPVGGLILTVGIDVQRNPARVAVVIRAWGRNGQSWCVYWGELNANSTIDPKDQVWSDLEAFIFREHKTEQGFGLFPGGVSIDSSDGFTSDAVYDWVRRMSKRYSRCTTMAIKGSSDKSRKDPEIFTTPRTSSIDHKDPKKKTKADRKGLKVYQVGTNKAKDWIFGQLKLLAEGVRRFNFYTGIRDDYFDQILGAVKAPDKNGRLIWVDKNEPHEVLDCEVYALHAARALRVHLKTPEQWDLLEGELSQVDLFGGPELLEADEPVVDEPVVDGWQDDSDEVWV